MKIKPLSWAVHLACLEIGAQWVRANIKGDVIGKRYL
jgi:hypothetical protein